MFLLRPKNFDMQTRNAERWVEVSQIAAGLKAYVAAIGSLPPGIATKTQVIGKSDQSQTYDLCKILVPKYMKEVPYDPSFGLGFSSESGTGSGKACKNKGDKYATAYSITKYVDGSVVLAAPLAEEQEQISIRLKFPTQTP